MSEERVHFKSSDGTRLCGILTWPPENAKGAVILAHGITVEKDEGGFYVDMAAVLADAGLMSLRFDFRGHGESGGKPEEMTVEGETEDLAAAVTLVRERGFSAVAIVATSFGAGSTVLYARRHEGAVTCLALLAPVLDYRRTFLEPETEWAQEWFTPEALKQAEATGRLDLDGFPLGRALLGEFRRLEPANGLDGLGVPVLLVHGTEDSMVPYAVTHELAGRVLGCRFLPIEGADHGFEGFEERVFSEVVRWILKHAGG